MSEDLYREAIEESDPRMAKRRGLLEAAERLLEEEGPGSLSLRKIADACGVSTQMIYTLFGGKSDLLGALYSHGFERLAGYLDEVTDELAPPQRLAELGLAYRQFALDHPALYQMMTGRPFAEFEPPRAAQDRQTRSFQILQEAVADCIDAGHYRADLDPREVADIHWSAVHGAVGLEIAGFYDDPQVARQRFGLALQSVAAGFRGGA